ncbi:hypothetical protein HAX54_051429, partial [Datura stramonium]|nr:hypothetical protein [Datura stramonium]
MGYIPDEYHWVKKASFKPKAKISPVESSNIIPPDGSSSSALSSLITDLKDVKGTLGAVAIDLHKRKESLVVHPGQCC